MHSAKRWDWGREGILRMKCCVLNPVHAQGMHLVHNHRTLKHNSHERGDQSLYICSLQLSYPVLYSQLSHSGSEFDQYVKPDTDKAPCNEHERLSKHPGSGAHTLTHANIHPHTFFLLCVSPSQPRIPLFWSERLKNMKPAIHTLQAPPSPCTRSQNPIHLNNGEEESASARWSAAPLPPCIFEGANQSVCLTKFMKVPSLKKRR